MSAQRKIKVPRMSAKDREFEELLRRAAFNANRQMPTNSRLARTNLRVTRRKRVKAA